MCWLLGAGWDLLEKVVKKAATLFPKWAECKVQIESRDWQSRGCRPSDVIVLCPAEEIQREPTVVQARYCKEAFASEGVRQRCVDAGCTWRSCSKGLTGSGEEPPDIGADDKVDLLPAMLAEDAEAGEVDDGDGQGGVPAPSPEAEKVNALLWPYGRTAHHCHIVLETIGQSRKASTAVVISSTAHPGHWVACVLQGLNTFVFTRRWSNHSKQHGLALRKKNLAGGSSERCHVVLLARDRREIGKRPISVLEGDDAASAADNRGK